MYFNLQYLGQDTDIDGNDHKDSMIKESSAVRLVSGRKLDMKVARIAFRTCMLKVAIHGVSVKTKPDATDWSPGYGIYE